MNIKQLKEVVDTTTASGVTFASIIQETVPKMNKGGRGNIPLNPFYDRVVKKTKAVIMLGNNYGKAIENREFKLTGEKKEFETEEMKGKHWKEGYENLIAVKDTDETVMYLRTYHNMANNESKVVYLIDGVEATEEQMEELKIWLPKPSESKKQEEFGLDKKEQIVPRDVTLSNVKSLKIGDWHFSA